MSLPPIVYEGSVKDIRGNEGDSHLVFEYSDRYSVFDWGAMPDTLPEKGKSLAYMANAFFQVLGDPKTWQNWPDQSKFLTELKTKGMAHHGEALVDENQNQLGSKNADRFYKVKAVRVIRPGEIKKDNTLTWDYAAYQDKPTNALVPLEVIFRFGVPEGSSLLKRINDPAYLGTLGLTTKPAPGDKFEQPIIEYSTKLESSDRYIAYDEARRIAGLSTTEFARLHEKTICLAKQLKEIFAGIGVELWDGKFEYAFTEDRDENGDRDYMLVDSIGPDELRLTYKGVQLSKENLRRYYRGGPWCEAVGKAKTLADNRGESNWKRICEEELGQVPGHLKPELKEAASMMYKTLANEIGKKYLGEEVFENTWSMDRLIEEMR